MKCAACGYEKLGKGHAVVPETKILYKSGPKKGTVKEVIPEHTVYGDQDPDKEPFIEVFLSNSIEFRRYRISDYQYDYQGRFGEECKIFACPECHTLKLGV